MQVKLFYVLWKDFTKLGVTGVGISKKNRGRAKSERSQLRVAGTADGKENLVHKGEALGGDARDRLHLTCRKLVPNK